MRLPLLNRQFELPADGFCQIVPKGEFPIHVDPEQYACFKNARTTPAGEHIRVIQVIDDAACAAIMNSFQTEASKPDFVGLLVDREHDSCDPKGSTEASAWIMELQNRADGIFAKPRWAGDGEQVVKTGALRFFSPVFIPQDCELLSADRIRPLRLDEAALTNKPNMRTIKAITNTKDVDVHNAPSGQKGVRMDYKAELLATLGLGADASDEAIGNKKSETVALKNRADAAEAKVATLEKAQLETLVEKDLDQLKDRITNREEAKTLLLKNREDGLKLLGLMKPGAPTQPVLNRDDGAAPDTTGAVRNQAQLDFVEKLRNDRRCTYSEAWALAPTIKPELFKK